MVGMARFTRTPSKPAVRREPHRLAETNTVRIASSSSERRVVPTSSDRSGSSEQELSLQLGSPGMLFGAHGLSMNFFMESLILAQDERWRRA